jgi:3-dehydrosphinganine reductase
MGKAVAIQLAQKGANVIIVARDVPKLKGALEEIRVRAYAFPHTRSPYPDQAFI